MLETLLNLLPRLYSVTVESTQPVQVPVTLNILTPFLMFAAFRFADPTITMLLQILQNSIYTPVLFDTLLLK